MKAHRYSLTLLIGVTLLTGCRAGAQAPSAPDEAPAEEQDIEGMERLAPELPTGVHLQAVYQVPPELDGAATEHSEMNYVLYLPQGYDEASDRPWPMIMYLHGASEGEYDSNFVMNSGLPAVLFAGEQPEGFSFVVVSPQAFEGGTWWSGDTVPVLEALLGEVLRTYRVDPARVYLTGVGMGGHGAWHLAAAYPDRFAALVSISGSGYDPRSLSEGDNMCGMRELPIWAIHGALDTISDPEISRLNAIALQTDCDGKVEWTLYADVGHIGAQEKAYRDPAVFDWMLEHSR